MKPKILVVGEVCKLSGFGEFTRVLGETLELAGYEVAYFDVLGTWLFSDYQSFLSLHPRIEKFAAKTIRAKYPKEAVVGFDLVMLCHPVFDLQNWFVHFSTLPIICCTTFEATPLPARYGAILTHAQKVITLSGFSKDMLDKAGVRDVTVVPVGMFSKDCKISARSSDVSYSFLNISSWSVRKNLEDLFVAYACVEDICKTKGLGKVELTLKTSLPSMSNVGHVYTQKCIADLMKHIGYPAMPNVKVHTSVTTDEETIAMIQSADCYVSTSFGETPGLPMFDAFCNGLDIVSHNKDGSSEYLTDKTVGYYSVNAHKAVPINGDGFSPFDYTTRWFRPNVDEVIEQMVRCVETRSNSKKSANNKARRENQSALFDRNKAVEVLDGVVRDVLR